MAISAAQVAVVLSGITFFACFFYLAAYRPVIFVAFFFILFSLLWRTCSMMFIDLAGPVLSTQTYHYVGPGTVAVLHVLAYLVALAPFLFLLRQRSLCSWLQQKDERPAAAGMLTLSDFTLLISLLFVAYLYFDLVRNGTIPLFSRMERFVYTAQYAGAAHRWLIEYGNFLTFWWGLMFAAERLRNKRLDVRYLALLGLLVVYMFVTGNRFSAFYSFGSFFLIPLSAPIADAVARSRAQAPFAWLGRVMRRRELVALGATTALLIVPAVVGIYNNLTNVRGYRGSEIASQFLERALIQPGELGWLSYDRVFAGGEWQPYRVFDFLFQTPLDPNRNTTPQYLMLSTIGEPRTFEHISGGFQFAGGYPEIFFELFGPVFAWPFLFAASYIAAGLTALIVKGTLQGRYASAFMALYLLYGLYVMYIGGMLNFIAVWTYWAKIGALMLALLLEASLARAGLPLVPWSLFPVGKIGLRRWIPVVMRPNPGTNALVDNPASSPVPRLASGAKGG